MQRLMGLAAIAVTAIALTVGGAAAQGGLTDAQVDSFIKAYPDVVKFADESGAQLKNRGRGDRAERRDGEPFARAIPMLKQQGLYDKLARVVRPHGFSSPEAFAGTADRVIRAFAAPWSWLAQLYFTMPVLSCSRNSDVPSSCLMNVSFPWASRKMFRCLPFPHSY